MRTRAARYSRQDSQQDEDAAGVQRQVRAQQTVSMNVDDESDDESGGSGRRKDVNRDKGEGGLERWWGRCAICLPFTCPLMLVLLTFGRSRASSIPPQPSLPAMLDHL